jgi:hypothetical protein
LINGPDIFAGTDSNGVLISTNNGLNWSQTPLNSHRVTSLALIAGNLYAGTCYSALNINSGVYVSTNNGLTWTHTSLKSRFVKTIYANGQNIFAGSDGLFYSSDNGLSWIAKEFPATSNILSFSGSDSIMLLGCNNYDVYLSTNFGQNWSFNSSSGGNPNSFLINGPRFLAGKSMGIYLSTNYGVNWNNVIVSGAVNAFAVLGSNIFAGRYNGVLISTNNGSSWNPTAASIIYPVFSLAVKGSTVFAGTQGGGIYYSTNNGVAWVQTLNGETVYSLAVNGGNVIAGTFDGGVYISTNDGVSWVQRNEGLTDRLINSLFIDSGYLYAGTGGASVWRRPISEIVGFENVGNLIPGKFNLSQNYPNPFNPATKIKFELPSLSRSKSSIPVKLVIYDLSGREVATLVNEELKPGSYEAEWYAPGFSSGVYFYRLISGDYIESKKMVLIK